MLFTLILSLTLTTNPALKFKPIMAPRVVQEADTIAMLSKTWVLREQFHTHRGELEPVRPHEQLQFTLRKNGTYTLNRHYGVADAGTVEEGRWEYMASERYISMQTREVGGGSILSTMLPRWEVKEISGNKLVLRQVAMSGQYMVLEAQK